jgi:hypothetical protein
MEYLIRQISNLRVCLSIHLLSSINLATTASTNIYTTSSSSYMYKTSFLFLGPPPPFEKLSSSSDSLSSSGCEHQFTYCRNNTRLSPSVKINEPFPWFYSKPSQAEHSPKKLCLRVFNRPNSSATTRFLLD